MNSKEMQWQYLKSVLDLELSIWTKINVNKYLFKRLIKQPLTKNIEYVAYHSCVRYDYEFV